ncbi:MAG: hypothetical protein ACI845_003781 [Gammaproteobacteria bacterium]
MNAFWEKTIMGGKIERQLIEGKLALIVIDIQAGTFEDCVAESTYDAHEASLRVIEYLQTGARHSLAATLDAKDSYNPS